MKIKLKAWLAISGLILSAVVLPSPSSAQDDAKQEHHGDITSRGDSAMGFDAARATHHFLQNPWDGAIEASANDPRDTASRDRIQHHLQQIAHRSKEGDFNIYAWTRIENVDRTNDLLLGENSLPPGFDERFLARAQAYTFGYDREFNLIPHGSCAFGGQYTLYTKPSSLDSIYGSHPMGVLLFLRLCAIPIQK
jgi:hypothetical protein